MFVFTSATCAASTFRPMLDNALLPQENEAQGAFLRVLRPPFALLPLEDNVDFLRWCPGTSSSRFHAFREPISSDMPSPAIPASRSGFSSLSAFSGQRSALLSFGTHIDEGFLLCGGGGSDGPQKFSSHPDGANCSLAVLQYDSSQPANRIVGRSSPSRRPVPPLSIPSLS